MAREMSHMWLTAKFLSLLLTKKIIKKKENVRLMKDPSVEIVWYSEINIYGYWNKNLV